MRILNTLLLMSLMLVECGGKYLRVVVSSRNGTEAEWQRGLGSYGDFGKLQLLYLVLAL